MEIQQGGGSGIGPDEYVSSINAVGDPALTGAVTLSAGSNITLTQVGQDIEISSTGGGGVTFGTTTQVPYMNAGGTDFIYSSDFTFNGTELYALGGRIGTNLYFDDTSSAIEKNIGVDAQASSNVEGNALSIYSGRGNGSGANGNLRLYLPSQTISDSTTDSIGQSTLHLNYIGGVTGLTIANGGNNDVFENANMSLNSAYNSSGNQVRGGNLDINGGDGTLSLLSNYIDIYTGQIGINGGLLTIDADYATGGSIEVQGGSYIADDEELTAGSVRILAGTIGGSPSYTTFNGRITLQQADNEFDFSNGGQTGILDFGSLTGGRTFTFPDTTGTIALTSNLPTYGTDNQIPFTNSTGTNFDYSANFLSSGNTLLVGTGNTINATYRLQLEESANNAVYGLIRHNTSGTNSTAQLAVVTPTAGGFFGAFDNSHNQTAWRDKAMFGAYSTASGIQIAAYNSGQKIWFQVGGISASNIWATMLGTGHLSLASNLDPLTNLHIQEGNTETLPAVYINQTSTGDSAMQFSIVGDAYAMGIDNSDSDAFKISYSGTAGAAVLGTNDRFIITNTGNAGVGISVATASAKFNVLSTTEQLRLHYDASNYASVTVDSNGATTFNANGAGASFIFNDLVTVQVATINTGIEPDADNGAYLGTTALGFSSLDITATGLIRFGNDVSVTHSTNTLAFTGGTNYTFDDRVTASGEIVFDGTTTSSGAGAVGITGSIHEITTTGTGDALTLADGVEGQRLTIVYVAETAGTDTAVITPTNFGSGTTITFATIGQSARLLFTNAKWYADGAPFGAVIA